MEDISCLRWQHPIPGPRSPQAAKTDPTSVCGMERNEHSAAGTSIREPWQDRAPGARTRRHWPRCEPRADVPIGQQRRGFGGVRVERRVEQRSLVGNTTSSVKGITAPRNRPAASTARSAEAPGAHRRQRSDYASAGLHHRRPPIARWKLRQGHGGGPALDVALGVHQRDVRRPRPEQPCAQQCDQVEDH